jgi:type I restriction enzyme, S subunit
MASEREETTVGELVRRGILERPLDGNHGSIHPKGTDFVRSGVPFIMASDLVHGGIDTVHCSFITLKQAKSLRKGFAKRGDVLLSHKATLGRTAIVGEIPGDFVMLTPQVTYYRAKDPAKLNNRYLKYYFDSEQFQQVLQSWAGGGSTRAYIGITDQLRLPILLAPPREQKAIANLIGALDDKIELNRRMNATLEAMARALFRSWFVDFDPVRAKRDGRKPVGLDATTAAHFSASFQDSPLGRIPKGWKAVPLYETAQWVNGAAFKSEDFCAAGDGLPVIKIGELKAGISPQTKWSQRQANAEQVIDTGDLLYSWSGSPDTSLEAFLWSGGLGLLNQHIFKVNTPTPAQKRFFYYLLQYLRPVLVETARNKQTTGLGHVTVADMKRLLVCQPSKEVLAAFDQNIAPIFDRAFANTLESRTLAALRDTLLPKLLSGEVRVSGSVDNLVPA